MKTKTWKSLKAKQRLKSSGNPNQRFWLWQSILKSSKCKYLLHSLKSCVSKLWIFFNVFSWFTIAYNLIAQRSVKMPPGHISVNGTPVYIKRVLMEPGKMSKVKTLFECLFIFKWNQKFLIIIRFCWNGTRCIQIRLLTARVFCGFLTNILIVQPVLSCINRFI